MRSRVLYPISHWLVWTVFVPIAMIAIGVLAAMSVDRADLKFDNPTLWWIGGVGPLAGLIVLYGVVRRRRALDRFASPELAPLLASRMNPPIQSLRQGLFVVALTLIAAGIIGPRWGLYLEQQKVYGVDIVVALDVSRSMWAEDVAPNRLARAKESIRQQLIERAVFQRANRMALLAFAGSTSLRLPLTTDHLAFRTKLEALRVGSAPRGGTAIAKAIETATDLFAKSPPDASRILLLLTDGEDHEGDPVEAARIAFRDHHIRTYTVGVGDAARTVGAQVPIHDAGSRKTLLHDGQIVFSKLNEAELIKTAEAGGGQYAPIGQLHRLVDAMAAMRTAELATEKRIVHKPRYQWFIAAALILLAMETMMSDRRKSVSTLPQRVWQQEASA